MKKLISIFLYSIGVFTPMTQHAQGLQVNPPSSSTKKEVLIPHVVYPSGFLICEPNILSIDMNEVGNQVVKLELTGGVPSLQITEVSSGKSSEIKAGSLGKASQVYFINDRILAIQIQGESPSFEIIEIQTGKVISSVAANKFIGSTATAAYFSNQLASASTIEKFDLASHKVSNSGSISGEVFGWYFSKTKGIIGVVVHSNMLSKIYSVENDKTNKTLFEFSSNYYFEAKGCSENGEVLFGITNFQSTTTYGCVISKNGIKPLDKKNGENCVDLFAQGNDIVLNTNSINAASYQESKNTTFQNILKFSQESFKGSTVSVVDYSAKSNSILYCIQSETLKPRYFVWSNNKSFSVSSDKYDAKNLTFIPSEVSQIQTGELTPQTGRMYLPTKAEKSSYPLVIYIPNNIFLPYGNEFNPTVQHLCQNGYAVFVWNTRFSSRPKIGFTYADLVASFPEDVNLMLTQLKKEYPILSENTFIAGEGIGAYLAFQASASSNDSFTGAVINRINFPGREYSQDLLATRFFGEDAQAKWSTLDLLQLSKRCNYLVYSAKKSKQEIGLANTAVQSKIKWTEHGADWNTSARISAKELDILSNWIQRFSEIETRVFDDKPKVEVKKK